jgi:alkyldihydroxyacetonephosphate synthase
MREEIKVNESIRNK